MTPEQYAEYRDHAEAHALTLEANSNAADTLAALDGGKSILARVAPRPHWDATQEANAALIASAPDLLAALKSAVSYLEANRPKGNIREIFHQLNEYENGVLKPARAAIAQAEGGAQ